MAHSQTGFLEGLYEGKFNRDLFPSRFKPVDETKTASFVERFREALTGYDPHKLEELHTIPPDLMGRLKTTGIFGLIIPREYGGLGFSLREYLSAVESMASTDLSIALIPLAHLSIGVMGILLFGTEDQKKRYLPRAASGEMVFAYALTEPDTGSDAQHVRTSARRMGESCYVLNGTKTYITNANYAGAFTVFGQMDGAGNGGGVEAGSNRSSAAGSGGVEAGSNRSSAAGSGAAEGSPSMGAFIVERAWQGVSVGRDMPKMGLSVSSTAAIRFTDVQVPRENLIGEPGDGFRIAMTILNYGRLGLGAAGSAVLGQSLRDMTQRAASRKQFGRPIGDFELIQEKLVHAKVHGYASAAMTAFAAEQLEKDPLMNVAIETSHCKLYGTTRGWETLYDALQTAGGSGYLTTLPYEKRTRDFRVTTIFEGTTEIHSVYPSLAVFRALGKTMKGRNPLQQALMLRRARTTCALAELRETHPVLKSALAAARESERLFRRFLVHGLRSYGRNVADKELFLKRMTNLSMSLYWLVASVTYLKARHTGGSFPGEELDIISYLTAEAREVQRTSRHPEDSRRKDALHTKITAGIRGV